MHGLSRIFGISDIEMFFLEPIDTLCPSYLSFGSRMVKLKVAVVRCEMSYC